MATTIPLSTKKPVKLHQFRIAVHYEDGTVQDVTTNQRSVVIGALNAIAPYITHPANSNATKVVIDIGNGLDTQAT